MSATEPIFRVGGFVTANASHFYAYKKFTLQFKNITFCRKSIINGILNFLQCLNSLWRILLSVRLITIVICDTSNTFFATYIIQKPPIMSKRGNGTRNVKQRRMHFLFSQRGRYSDVATINSSANGFDDLFLLTNRAGWQCTQAHEWWKYIKYTSV